jgi:DNA-binding IclR family transcriptional regulator
MSRSIIPSNRSLVRGVNLLKAFRAGSGWLGNAEIAARTALPKATVSRLTQTLVSLNWLVYDASRRAYALSPSVLSLGHAMRTGSDLLSLAAPLMREVSTQHAVNVGLASADGFDMVYLESIRYERRAALRQVLSGQRIPMELTALGRAHLSSLKEDQRLALLTQISTKYKTGWAAIQKDIDAALMDLQDKGFCAASWQPQAWAMAKPFVFEGLHCAINVSTRAAAALPQVFNTLERALGDYDNRLSGACRLQVGEEL